MAVRGDQVMELFFMREIKAFTRVFILSFLLLPSITPQGIPPLCRKQQSGKDPARILILEFSASIMVRNQFMFFISCPVSGVVV